MTAPVLRIETLDLSVGSFEWDFARKRRAEIDAHFEAARRSKPGLWNGRILLMHSHEIESACLWGSYFETDFASFMAWRDFGFVDPGINNCFALGALQGSDGGYVMGVMGGGTANAGKVYFPGGTPDLNDVVGRRVDLESSVRREVQEETGLAPDQFDIDPGWHCVPAGPLIALLKPMRARETAEQLRDRIRAHLALEADPELADVYIARGEADIHPMMPGFIQTFLRSAGR
ncbi:NUDIX hydrolase [Pseudorhodoplanes sp.]|uniref:NUDIX hydrolase n=1 Tax=Pseudorhodoplanes sp. TaxID=1934341 RepID=UPI002C9A3ACE|nr:NUDIX hydrolase [Pseudorhodoplanes sp.]HWV53593.1 NUDIX hydrolase [Pseudorhodoplanes sp.]